ncbi:MAG: DUF4388 domain-containing protein [Acidobacteriota bacterium]
MTTSDENAPRTRSPGGRGRYRVLVDAPELLMLGKTAATAGQRVLMAGEVLTPSTVLEVINVIASSRWVGDLHLYGTDSHRVLGLAKGVLLHARSDHPDDRLDRVLFRSGAVRPARLSNLLPEIRPEQRLGEVLVERGWITRQQLFEHLQLQMKEILLSAVLAERGTFVFSVSDEPAPPPDATAHIAIQHLILSAAERVDTFASFRKLVPDSNQCPWVEAGLDVTSLDAAARRIVGLCDGERSVREIACESWLGKYAAMEAIYHLVRQGGLRLMPPRRTAEEAATALAGPFNEVLEELYHADGDEERGRREVREWVEANGLLDHCLDDRSLLDADRLALGLGEHPSEHQIDALRSALHELAAYALFTVSLRLPRPEERALAQRLHQRLRDLG